MKRKLDTLTIFRALLEDPVIDAFRALADDTDDYISDYIVYAEESGVSDFGWEYDDPDEDPDETDPDEDPEDEDDEE